MSDELAWLMDWYTSQCDGDWEHSYGVAIETLDNPGWSLKVDLKDTDLEGKPFAKLEHELESDVSWWVCRVEDDQFQASCGPRDLAQVISVFRAWAA